MTDNAGKKHEVYTILPEFAGAILLDNPASDPAKCETPLTLVAVGESPVELGRLLLLPVGLLLGHVEPAK